MSSPRPIELASVEADKNSMNANGKSSGPSTSDYVESDMESNDWSGEFIESVQPELDRYLAQPHRLVCYISFLVKRIRIWIFRQSAVNLSFSCAW